jgi:hypothetical protein
MRSKSSASSEENVEIPAPEESYGTGDLRRIQKRAQGRNLKRDANVLNYTVQDKHFRNRSTQGGTEDYDGGKLEIMLQASTTEQPMDYDYESLRSDYYSEVEEALHSNTSFNYTTKNRPEETIGDVVQEILDFQKPKDCSKEEARNFGIKSIECLWSDFKKSHTKMGKLQLFKRIMMILLVWLFIYVAIAVLCWCKYGLCCCCCRCAFCRPRKLINKAKKYVATNEPGVLVEGGMKKRHEPTVDEIEAYNELLSSIRAL